MLDAGIDVISTVNIQHLASLNDVVEQITGVVQRETVPDAVVRRADQIELVDMSPEALRRRMAHGNIYPPEQRRCRARQLLPRRQPRGAARARAPVGRRPRRRRAPDLPGALRHQRAVGDQGAGRGRDHRRAERRTADPPRRAHGRRAQTVSSSACTSRDDGRPRPRQPPRARRSTAVVGGARRPLRGRQRRRRRDLARRIRARREREPAGARREWSVSSGRALSRLGRSTARFAIRVASTCT